MQSSLTTYYDPHAKFSLREHELRVIRDEFEFLQTCGGVSNEDIARFRVQVLKHMPPLLNANNNDGIQHEEVIVVKDEPEDNNSVNNTTLQGSGLVSLKSVLLGIGCHPRSINTSCRRVKALLLRSKIPTLCRNGATHVRVSDCMRIKSVIGFCSSEHED